MAAKQKGVEELQGLGVGAASTSTSVLQQLNLEAFSHTDDKLRKSNPDEGQDSGESHDFMMEKLCEYLKLTEDCMDGVQIMPSPKFNKEQCGYLVEKLEATLKRARLLIEECQAQPITKFSIMDMKRWANTFKLLMVSSKQIEGFFQECGDDAWLQTAMALANVGEYVSSIGFNLELCKVALSEKGDVPKSLTMDDVDKLSANEVKIVKRKAWVDAKTLLEKAIEVQPTLNAQDLELAKYLMFKLKGGMAIPSFAENNSNVIIELFEWVKNVGGRVEQIGRGGSARVYKVMWLGIPVAKKTFDGPNVEGFLQEVKVLSQLHHPNITSMFCCNMNRRDCSIVMELMDGSLYDLLRSRRGNDSEFLPFSDLEGLDFMLQVGEGVEYLHSKKIVHRDLKSANILVKRMEVLESTAEIVLLKVVDFGLSKTKESSVSSSSMTYNVGSNRWMAPEIIKFKDDNRKVQESFGKLPKYNFKGDIYSLGMVFMEILTGEVPFQSFEEKDVKKMVSGGKRPMLPKDCIPRLGELIKKCCSQKPNERPSIGAICLELKYLKCLLLTSGLSMIHDVGNLHLDDEPNGDLSDLKCVISEKFRQDVVPDYDKSYLYIDIREIELGHFIIKDLPKEPNKRDEHPIGEFRKSKWFGAECVIQEFKSIDEGGFAWNMEEMMKEVDSLVKLRHPHIMQPIGWTQYGEKTYVLYDKMDSNLRDLMKARIKKSGRSAKPRPFSPSEELSIIRQIAQGMFYLHQQGVVHGKLKCTNMLVKQVGDHIGVKVSDFTMVLGSNEKYKRTHRPRWSPPEAFGQFDLERPPSHDELKQGDVYSFAMTCCEILTGGYPFDGIRGGEAVGGMILRGERPKLPDHLNGSMLKGLIEKCWSANPKERPTFEEVRSILLNIADLPIPS